MSNYLVSNTAYQSGFGTAPYKHVHGLSAEERAHIRNGGTVYFRSSARSGGSHGTYWRYAKYCGSYGFAPRVPSAGEIAMLDNRN